MCVAGCVPLCLLACSKGVRACVQGGCQQPVSFSHVECNVTQNNNNNNKKVLLVSLARLYRCVTRCSSESVGGGVGGGVMRWTMLHTRFQCSRACRFLKVQNTCTHATTKFTTLQGEKNDISLQPLIEQFFRQRDLQSPFCNYCIINRSAGPECQQTH